MALAIGPALAAMAIVLANDAKTKYLHLLVSPPLVNLLTVTNLKSDDEEVTLLLSSKTMLSRHHTNTQDTVSMNLQAASLLTLKKIT